MTTVVLQSVGASIGGAIAGPFGAVVGRAVGGLAGSAIDQKLFGSNSKDRIVEGPRLDGTRMLTSNEGAPIPKVYGRNRVAGQIIWATRFEETSQVTGGGGGGGKGSSGSRSTPARRTYSYFANLAVGICDGPVSCLRRVWADGREVDLTKTEYRFYNGSETQQPDPLIEAKQGSGNAPAYRGTAYVVFDSFPLADYGNRIPQLTFEIVRSIGKLEKDIRSITIIPGSTEYGYSPGFVSSGGVATKYHSHNRHMNIALTDWKASIDELQAVCPNLETVSLVIAWFGTDLRMGECKVLPGVTTHFGAPWAAGGKLRHQAHLISQYNGRGVYGGTPSDASVVAAINDLKARGLRVLFYPFIMMDIPNGNTLPNPKGGIGQPVYPWRGEITCYPAQGLPGTADKTATARTQMNAFCSGAYGSYQYMILYYAQLCANIGGVDGFLIGSEMRGVSRVRDNNNQFPFVEVLVGLASQARQILGAGCKISYAADWSEYFGHQPPDGSGDAIFHLDPLWARPEIDAISIDNYMPLADWRDAGDPGAPEFHSIHSVDYLKSNISRGEGYDWYYASSTDRENAVRTPITDGQGEPWIYRYKDLYSWWSNPHHNRYGGVRSATPTAWQPQSKPFYFTEVGCPAVDKGPNQPNVFFDPKSDQSALPYFSAGGRDELVQRRYLEAHYEFWQEVENNPVSTVYGGPMVDVSEIAPWCWDARPFPWFPLDTATWSDGDNWYLGHWLNGRLGGCSVADLLQQILLDHGYDSADITVDSYLDGYVIPAQASARSALEPLLGLFNIQTIEENGEISFKQHGYSPHHDLTLDEIVQEGEEPLKTCKRQSELELPSEAVIHHYSVFGNYEHSAAKSRRIEGQSDRQISLDVPAVMSEQIAVDLADRTLRDANQTREECRISLAARRLEIATGDVVRLEGQPHKQWLVESVETGARQDITMRSVDDFPVMFSSRKQRARVFSASPVHGQPEAYLMDLPLLRSADASRHFSHLAVAADPWARAYSVFSSPSEDGFDLRADTRTQAVIATLLEPVAPGPVGVWDKGNSMLVTLASGQLESASDNAVLNGANTAALLTANGNFEILQFSSAILQEDGNWRISNLLRAQFGSEAEMAPGAETGAKLILLNGGILPLEIESHEVGLVQNWRIGPSIDPVSADTYAQIEHANSARSRRMLSPVHLRTVETGGDIKFTWIRRGRVDADNWDAAEIPLDAGSERYHITIANNEDEIVREAQTTMLEFVYTETDITTDFGGPASFSFSVSQLADNGLPGAASTHVYSPN